MRPRPETAGGAILEGLALSFAVVMICSFGLLWKVADWLIGKAAHHAVWWTW